MTSRIRRPVMTFEVRRMREMHEAGFTRHQIAKRIGRSHPLISRHLPHTVRIRVKRESICHGLKANALRIESLFAACNRALAIHSPSQVPA